MDMTDNESGASYNFRTPSTFVHSRTMRENLSWFLICCCPFTVWINYFVNVMKQGFDSVGCHFFKRLCKTSSTAKHSAFWSLFHLKQTITMKNKVLQDHSHLLPETRYLWELEYKWCCRERSFSVASWWLSKEDQQRMTCVTSIELNRNGWTWADA